MRRDRNTVVEESEPWWRVIFNLLFGWVFGLTAMFVSVVLTSLALGFSLLILAKLCWIVLAFFNLAR